MQNTRIKILSTRPLERPLIEAAEVCGIDIETISFIETEAITDDSVSNKIKALSREHITAVFTSMNAVEVVSSLINTSPNWKVGSIGTTTQRLIEKKLKDSSIIATGNNASELAQRLATIADINKMIFFCGDQRRDELPTILKDHGIEVEEIVVYRTIPQPIRIDKYYDGIAFYSPSAVDSFFSVNELNTSTIVFSIGSTTSDAIHKYADNKIVVTSQPGKENLVNRIIDYYTSTQKPVNS
jgi:uroporphyrinogen-III synthase